ncbi:MAG: DUF2807 domain-containing protein [Prevotella sp.]|nr:DUF2807 domain-containing protein [Prevotella sp.]
MKKIYSITTIITLILALTVLASCKINIEKKGDGTITEKTFTVSDFNSIQFSGATTVHYTVSDTVSIRIKASEELLKRMRVETDAYGVLNIYSNESKKIGKNKFLLSFDDMRLKHTSADHHSSEYKLSVPVHLNARTA